MYSRPKENRIVSDSGFAVEILGRTGLRYDANGGSLHVNAELLLPPSGMAIYKSSITHWDNSIHGSVIEGSERSEIVENIRDAFKSIGWDIVVFD
jgi:hypothetical protein